MDTHGGTSTGRFRRAAARGVAATLAGVVALTAYAAPAQAADRVVRDRGGADDTVMQGGGTPTTYGELRALRVRFTDTRLVVRFVPSARTLRPDFYDVFIDTDRDGRPERRVRYDGAYGPSRFAQAYRADGFGANPVYRREVCARVPRTDDVGGRQGRGSVITMRIPLRCLGGPTPSVRVTGFTAMEYGIADWAPGPRRLSAPIRRG